MKKIFVTLPALLILATSSVQMAFAQDAAAPAADGEAAAQNSAPPTQQAPISPEELILQMVEEEVRELYKRDSFVPPDFPSLFFLPGEHSALRAAIASFITRPPAEGEVEAEEEEIIDTREYPREVKLGGIMFQSVNDWIIWVNDTKITPNAIPAEIMDLNVAKDAVELRWFDGKTNKIYPIRLRPNQRFNLDARMFLPGS